MIISKTKAFKYNGRRYMIFETEYDGTPGFTYRSAGSKCILVLVNKALCKRERQVAIHRLITGRGLQIVNKPRKGRRIAC